MREQDYVDDCPFRDKNNNCSINVDEIYNGKYNGSYACDHINRSLPEYCYALQYNRYKMAKEYEEAYIKNIKKSITDRHLNNNDNTSSKQPKGGPYCC